MFLFVVVPCEGQKYVIVAFPGYTHLLCLIPVLIDFPLTVKAATLIFISGRGSAISFAQEGKSVCIYNLAKS